MARTQDDILIARYLDGTLSPEEFEDIQNRRQDSAFEHVLNTSVKISHAVSTIPHTEKDTNKAWSKIQSSIQKQETSSNRMIVRIPRKSWIGMAATLVILASLWIFQQKADHYGDGGIITATDSDFTTVLNDGSIVTLKEGSRISLPSDFGSKSRKLKASGQIHFDVQPGEKPFVIHSDQLTIRVLGTEFTLKTGESAFVKVIHGTVEVGHLKDIKKVVSGNKAFVKDGGLVTSPGDTTENWANQVWSFKDVPLSTVVQRVENVFDLQIEMPEKYLKTTVTLKLESPEKEEIVNVLSKLSGLQVQVRGNSYFFN